VLSAAKLLLTRARRRLLLAPLLALCAVGTACRARDPKRELAVDDLETYWAIARSAGDTHYLAPVVRFQLRAIGEAPLRSVQANATFRRQGEEGRDWGSAFQQLVVPSKPLEPGQSLLVVLTSDTHYYTNGAPEGIFGHEQFKDAGVELFLRVGASSWVAFGEAAVERRIGARSVQDLVR
jgi:hypothetical protein